jgi:hypothetical protein
MGSKSNDISLEEFCCWIGSFVVSDFVRVVVLIC